MEREPGFSAPLRFACEGLPDGVVLDKYEFNDTSKTVALIIRAQEGAQPAPGEYRITVSASGGLATEAAKAFFLRIET
jgi:hypothetical protein